MDLFNSIAQFFNTWGWLGITIFIVYGGAKGWFVFGWQYREEKGRAEFWRDRYFVAEDKADRAIDTLAEAVALVKVQKPPSGRTSAGGRSGQ